jgi:excinuclease ABC subunit C
MRDEAHRSALSFHRKIRGKRSLSSKLDTLPGIGPVKRKRLLQHFGSVQKIKEASREELLSIKGIHQKEIDILGRYL